MTSEVYRERMMEVKGEMERKRGRERERERVGERGWFA